MNAPTAAFLLPVAQTNQIINTKLNPHAITCATFPKLFPPFPLPPSPPTPSPAVPSNTLPTLRIPQEGFMPTGARDAFEDMEVKKEGLLDWI